MASVWRASFEVEEARAEAAGDALQSWTSPQSVATGVLAEGAGATPGLWRVEALYDAPPDRDALRLALAAAGFERSPPLAVEEIAERDWVRASLRALPPVVAGRLMLHGGHDPGPEGRHLTGLLIEAGLAFGTGHHETTRGCLIALSELQRAGRPARILDVGCGTGALGIAAARIFRAPVVMSDIDPLAARVAGENARANRVGPLALAIRARGLDHPLIKSRAPYDLIFANILAKPLMRLAGDIAAALAPGGRVVLSGLLTRQARRVSGAYDARGLLREREIEIGPWTTLVMGRPLGKSRSSP